MKLRSVAVTASLIASPLVACGGGGSPSGSSPSGSSSTPAGSASSSSSISGSPSSGSATESSSATSAISSGGNTSSGSTSSSTSGNGASSGSPSTSSGDAFDAGTICNATGTPKTPPATLKNIIVILEENKNLDDVKGQASAPYLNSLGTQCGTATAYNDNLFAEDLVSLPHYLALTSGSNCDTGLDKGGTGCITDDGDATSHTLSTTSIFDQVTSWKSYMESMPSACDASSKGEYATKHNPAPYYTALSSCSSFDLPIDALTCDPSNTNAACTPAPDNAFTQDLANDTLPAFTLISPNLLNDMHDGTVTQADNWLFTYLPLIFQSKAYLRGDVAVMVLWDEQGSGTGGATPNLFISPYVTAGTVASTPMNHFSMLRAWENALGITTYLGCASGTQPGSTATCPDGSTADIRAALNW